MYKTLTLAAMVATSVLANRVKDHVNTQMFFAMAKQDKIREKYGIEAPKSRWEYVGPAQLELEAAPAPPTISGWLEKIACNDKYDILRGFAYGLQYSPATQGACYISMDEAIQDVADITMLLQ